MYRTWLRSPVTGGIDGAWGDPWKIYSTYVTIVNVFIQYAHACFGTCFCGVQRS